MAAFQKQTKRSFLIASGLATACIALVLGLSLRTRPIQFLELGTYDWRVKLLDKRFAEEDAERAKHFVVIDIDNPSFDQLKSKLGRWPWSRAVWTEVVRWVAKGKPKVIGVDIIFTGQESPEVDQEFARVIRNAGNVVTSYTLSADTAVDSADTQTQDQARAAITREGRPGNFGEQIKTRTVLNGKEVPNVVLNVPIPEIASAARGLGLINSTPSPDGAIREVPLQVVMDGVEYPTLPARMANVALGRDDLFIREGRFAVRSGQKIPVNAEGRMTILWRNRQMEAARMPLWKVICSIYAGQCPDYQQEYTAEFFKDKVVLLGASVNASYDFHPTPLSDQTPGFIAHMSAVENIMNGEAVTPTPFWVQVVIVVLLTLLGSAALVSTQSTWQGITVGVVAAALYVGFSVLSFMSSAHHWFPLAAPMIGYFAAFVSTGLIRYQTTGRELRRTRGTLNRYVSPQLVEYVLDNLERINLAGEKRELSILFSDVRNFTTMTEAADPMELIKTLNEYLAEMTDVIFKYDGITDKFIGDGILAYWGAFTPGKNHAELASRAALEMLERLKVLNEGWKAEGRKELAIGIGINTGEVVFGNVGSGKKIEFTVIGDPVNLAARLESQTKEYGVQLIVSEFTAAKLNGDFQLRPLGGVKVKGKTVETKIFELQSVAEKAAAGTH